MSAPNAFSHSSPARHSGGPRLFSSRSTASPNMSVSPTMWSSSMWLTMTISMNSGSGRAADQLVEPWLERRLVDAGRAAVDEHDVLAVVQQQAVAVLGAEDLEGKRWFSHGYTDWIARRMSSMPWPW